MMSIVITIVLRMMIKLMKGSFGVCLGGPGVLWGIFWSCLRPFRSSFGEFQNETKSKAHSTSRYSEHVQAPQEAILRALRGGLPGRPNRAPRAAKRIHHHCIISVITCNTTLCGTPPHKSAGSASKTPWDLLLSPEAQIPRKLRYIRAPEATISRNSYGLLIASHRCTTFP